jgi:hypothetical protein
MPIFLPRWALWGLTEQEMREGRDIVAYLKSLPEQRGAGTRRQ